MSIEQKLLEIKEIGKLALEGKSDDEIARTTHVKRYLVPSIRSALGLRGRGSSDIFNSEPKKLYDNEKGGFRMEFQIPLHRLEEVGIVKGKSYAFTGKILSKNKIELTIKPFV